MDKTINYYVATEDNAHFYFIARDEISTFITRGWAVYALDSANTITTDDRSAVEVTNPEPPYTTVTACAAEPTEVVVLDSNPSNNVKNANDFVPTNVDSAVAHDGNMQASSCRHYCCLCCLSFDSKKSLDEHLYQHSEDKSLQCDQCRSRFNRAVNLTVHRVLSHSGHSTSVSGCQLECPLCDARLSRFSAFKSHLLLHQLDDSLSCETCGQCFASQALLDIHMKKHSGIDIPSPSYRCKYCVPPVVFESLTRLRLHYSDAHPTLIKSKRKRNTTTSAILPASISANPHDSHATLRSSGGTRQEVPEIDYRPIGGMSTPTTHQQLKSNNESLSSQTLESSATIKSSQSLTMQRFSRSRESQMGNSPIEAKMPLPTAEIEPIGDLCKYIRMVPPDTQIPEQTAQPTLEKSKEPLDNSPVRSAAEVSNECSQTSIISKPTPRRRKSRPSYACSVCRRKFKKYCLLQRHMLRHTGSKPFECILCHARFSQKSSAKTHLLLMHCTRPKHECPLCKREFNYQGNLVTHMKVHRNKMVNPSSKFVDCQFGGYIGGESKCIPSQATLGADPQLTVSVGVVRDPIEESRHIHSIIPNDITAPSSDYQDTRSLPSLVPAAPSYPPSKLEQSVRPTSQRAYRNSDGFLDHFHGVYEPISPLRLNATTGLYTKFPKRPNGPFECDRCTRTYSSTSHLRFHIRHHHCDANSLFKCQYCWRRFLSRSSRDRHLERAHNGLRPGRLNKFHCSECSAAFSNRRSLLRHAAVHSEERSFKCPLCFKCFKFSSSCWKHLRKHHSIISVNSSEVTKCSEVAALGTIKAVDDFNSSFHKSLAKNREIRSNLLPRGFHQITDNSSSGSFHEGSTYTQCSISLPLLETRVKNALPGHFMSKVVLPISVSDTRHHTMTVSSSVPSTAIFDQNKVCAADCSGIIGATDVLALNPPGGSLQHNYQSNTVEFSHRDSIPYELSPVTASRKSIFIYNVDPVSIMSRDVDIDASDTIQPLGAVTKSISDSKTMYENLFGCGRCDAMFATSEGLLTHHVNFHNAISQSTVSCPHCNKRLSSNTALTIHQLTGCCRSVVDEVASSQSNIQQKTFSCPLCTDKSSSVPIVFASKAGLTRHVMYRHPTPRDEPFRCTHCNQRFRLMRSLLGHIRKILSERSTSHSASVMQERISGIESVQYKSTTEEQFGFVESFDQQNVRNGFVLSSQPSTHSSCAPHAESSTVLSTIPLPNSISFVQVSNNSLPSTTMTTVVSVEAPDYTSAPILSPTRTEENMIERTGDTPIQAPEPGRNRFPPVQPNGDSSNFNSAEIASTSLNIVQQANIGWRPQEHSSLSLQSDRSIAPKFVSLDNDKTKQYVNSTVSRLAINNQRLRCSRCGVDFASKSHYKLHSCSVVLAHQSTVGSSSSSRFQPIHKCSLCSREFTRASALARHEVIHSKVRPFVCCICGAGFTQQSSLKTHEFIHEDEKAHRCSHCGAKFVQRGNLRRHIASVHREIVEPRQG